MRQDQMTHSHSADSVHLPASASVSLGDSLTNWRSDLTRVALRAMLVVGLFAVLFGSYTAYQVGNFIAIPIYWVVYALAAAFTLWRGIPYTIQTWLIIGLFYAVGVFETLNTGRTGDGRILLLGFALVAALFYGKRAGLIATGLNVLTLLLFGVAFSSGLLSVFSKERQAVSVDFFPWVSNAAVQTMVGVLLIFGYDFLLSRFAKNVASGQSLIGELQAQAQLLMTREAELAQRNTQLKAAAQIARETTNITDEEQLLPRSARLISELFGYAYAGVYVLDELETGSGGKLAILRASYDQAGEWRMAHGHALPINDATLVGRALRQAVAQMDANVDAGTAEIALPLRIHGRVVGALEVHGSRLAGRREFAAEEVEALQTVADQIAVALSNVRLVAQIQANLDMVRQAAGEASSQGWREFLRAQSGLVERYDPDGLLPPATEWLPELEAAMQSGEPVARQDGVSAQLVVPIRVRGQAVGVIDARKPTGEAWASAEIETVQTLIEQLGVALESARLYQDTQRRAARERLVSDVTGRMREPVELEDVLKVAVDEIRQVLDLDQLVLRLRPGAPDKTPEMDQRGAG
ncbi:MAG: GAF domain-containing protein [Anaerolineae bacterium]|nr:GAF domain-containing protein [Anaerolineae bacterium]